MFKVGDRVMAVRGYFDYYPSGAAGTVLEVLDHDYYVDFDNHPDVKVKSNGTRHWFVPTVIAAPVTPTSRSNDPATSKGERRINKYEHAVLSCLGEPFANSGPGLMQGVHPISRTGKEIAALTGHPLNSITPRFAPLRRKGLIKDSGLRRDKQIVWVLA